MKLPPLTFKGITFIRVSRLPEDQSEVFRQTENNIELFKINTGQEVLPDCLLFSYYERWYSEVYTKTYGGPETNLESQ